MIININKPSISFKIKYVLCYDQNEYNSIIKEHNIKVTWYFYSFITFEFFKKINNIKLEIAIEIAQSLAKMSLI